MKLIVKRRDMHVSRTQKLFRENVIPQNIKQFNNFMPYRNHTQITSGSNCIRNVDTLRMRIINFLYNIDIAIIILYYSFLNFFLANFFS